MANATFFKWMLDVFLSQGGPKGPAFFLAKKRTAGRQVGISTAIFRIRNDALSYPETLFGLHFFLLWTGGGGRNDPLTGGFLPTPHWANFGGFQISPQ